MENQFKHTPAPWTINENNPKMVQNHEVKRIIAVCENPEDAKLIAAAPELLEAAIEMVTNYGSDFNKTQAAEIKLRRAIKKATE